MAAAPAVSPGAPYTQHAQGCGRPGEVITLPEVLMTDWNSTVARLGSPAKLLVKEWAKLRYGVFDEHGFRGDPLYPNHYRVQGKWLEDLWEHPEAQTDEDADDSDDRARR